MSKLFRGFLFFSIFSGLMLSPFFAFIPSIKANLVSTSVVVITVCGNSIINTGELCDDGVKNGTYAYNAGNRFCNTSCDGWAAYCGDGTIQSAYAEQCDDSNNIANDGCSAVCQREITGGGGGGGYYAPPAVATKVIFQGKAYPSAVITLLKDGKFVLTQKADEAANFKMEIIDITSGIWTFSAWAEDQQKRKSYTLSFTTNVAPAVTTTLSDIFFPPTIELSKVNLQKGEQLNVIGQTAPENEVALHIESKEIIQTSKADKKGAWIQAVSTGSLEEGTHTTRAKAYALGGASSPFSQVLSFYVGKAAVVAPPQKTYLKADLNKDGKVNLIDFSILLYYWGKKNARCDLNQNGKVDLADFSIMLYYWTG